MLSREVRTAVLAIRITPTLKARLIEMADRDGRSVTNLTEKLLSTACDVPLGSRRTTVRKDEAEPAHA